MQEFRYYIFFEIFLASEIKIEIGSNNKNILGNIYFLCIFNMTLLLYMITNFKINNRI
jgi:hypothetical protein